MGKGNRKFYMFYLHGEFKNPMLEDWITDEYVDFYVQKRKKGNLILYGFTEDRDVAISFMEERNMKRFEIFVRPLDDLSEEENEEFKEFKRDYEWAELGTDEIVRRESVKIGDHRYLQTCGSIQLITNRFERNYIESSLEGVSYYGEDLFLSSEGEAILKCLGDRVIYCLEQMGLSEILRSLEDFTGNLCLDEFQVLLNLCGELFNKKVVKKKH